MKWRIYKIMSKTFTGTLRSVYRLPRRFIVAHGMRIEFINGVAKGIPEYQANLLMKNNVLASMVEEGASDFVVDTDVISLIDTVVKNPVVVSEASEVVEVPQVFSEEMEEEIPTQDAGGEVVLPESNVIDFQEENSPNENFGEVESEEWENVIPEELSNEGTLEPSVMTTMGEITRENMRELYSELKTWSAVASHLEVSTTVLRRYRDELGL